MDRTVPTGAAPSVSVRQFAEGDLNGLHRLDNSVFDHIAYPLFVLRQLTDLHSRYCVVADDGEQLIGYCLGAAALRPRVGRLLALGVLPQNRRYGYGRELLGETIRRLTADGVREVQTPVAPGNDAAIHLYETCGFRISGYQRDYFGPEADRLIMTLKCVGQ